MNYGGANSFTVQLMDSNGRQVAMLAGSTGPYNGSRALGVNSTGNYSLNVQATGPWTITITQPRNVGGPQTPLSLSGVGPAATEFFYPEGDPVLFKIGYIGAGEFNATILDTNGGLVATIIDQKGSFGGSQYVYLFPGYYMLNVQTDGKWNIWIGQ